MTYDGGIRLAHWEQGVPWAIGAGGEGEFPDLATIAPHVQLVWLTAYWSITRDRTKE